MRKIFQISLLFVSLVLLSSCSTFQPADSPYQEQIDSLLTGDLFKTAQTGFSAYDLTENKLLLLHNSNLLFRPASNQKILTTAAAYLFLGEEFNFSTSVYHAGEIKDSILHGDIFFKGNFDAGFTVDDLDRLVKQVKDFRIKEISGNIFADVSAMDSLYWGKGWMWDDDIQYITPLPVNGNIIKLIAKPGELERPVKYELYPVNDFCNIKNFSKTVNKDTKTLNVEREQNNNRVYVLKGDLPLKSGTDTLQLIVRDPVNYFLCLAKESIMKNGIAFRGKTDTLSLPLTAKKISSVEHNIVPIINRTNKISDNFSAELILRALALRYMQKSASVQGGFIFVDSLISLSGTKPKDFRLADGSGLSFYNLISPQLILNVLNYLYFHHPKIYQRLYESFPVAGVDGTLYNRMKNSVLTGKVHAKTGGLSGVSTLSGYLHSKNNHLIAFSIMVQDYTGSAERARQFQEKLCEIIYNQN